jgi:hypothetical protein
LGRFLVRTGGTSPDQVRLARVISQFDQARRNLRQERPRLTARQFAQAISWVRQDGKLSLAPDNNIKRTADEDLPVGQACGLPVPADSQAGSLRHTTESTPARLRSHNLVPLALVGGPLDAKDYPIFDIVEEAGGNIVLDGTETGERTLPSPMEQSGIEAEPLRALARAYFEGIPDVFRRPNHALYDWLGEHMAARNVQAILLRRYVWCDLWHAELERMRQWSPVPVLEIDVCEDGASLNRARGRIEAFLETLV